MACNSGPSSPTPVTVEAAISDQELFYKTLGHANPNGIRIADIYQVKCF